MEHYHFDCKCDHPEHTFRVSLCPHEKELYIEVCISDHPSFFKRLCYALRYIFRKTPSHYGYFDSIIIKQEDILRLQELLEKASKVTR